MPELVPAPIPLTKRKSRLRVVVAAGAMLGNDLDHTEAASSSARPGAPSGRAKWLETIEALPPPKATPTACEHFGGAVPAIVPPLRPQLRVASPPAEQPYPRFPTRVDIGLQSAHNFYAGFSSDIRAGGLFVATCAPFEAGEQLLLTFTVAGFAGAWSSRCIVDWTLPEQLERQGGPPGMGLRLLDLDPQITAAINRFMRQRDPIFYEPR